MTSETDRKSSQGQGKAARVAFDPQPDTYIPPISDTPAPSIGHHQRSQTQVDLQRDARPNGHPHPSAAGSSGQVVSPDTETLPRPARPTSTLVRAKSDYLPHHSVENAVVSRANDEDFQLRHGWQEEHNSPNYLKDLHSVSRWSS